MPADLTPKMSEFHAGVIEMPQTTPEKSARWPGMDAEAYRYLKACGFTLTRQWTWIRPSPEHIPTEREIDASIYLIEEWDYGGIEDSNVR